MSEKTPEQDRRQTESPEPGSAGATEGGPSHEEGTPPISEEGEHGQTTSPSAPDDVGVPDDPGSDK